MDVDSLRKQLAIYKAELARVEEARDALIRLITGSEDMLRIYGSSPKGDPIQTKLMVDHADAPIRSNRPSGSVSIRSAIVEVLRMAQGAPLHSQEIWNRVEAMGGRTRVNPPKDVVDLNLVSLRKRYPIEKVPGVARTYRWVGANLRSRAPEVRREPTEAG